jgi:hypothetical protein
MTASVDLGGLAATDLRVEFEARRLLPDASLICAAHPSGMASRRVCARSSPRPEKAADGGALFSVGRAAATGQYQLEVRVYPWHELLSHPLEVG